MKLIKVKYCNFGPFVEAEMTFDGTGLVLVQGDNQLSTSADSNGSGKSFLLEGVVWGAYGRTIRYDLHGEPTGDRIVNDKFGPTPGKNCRIEQTWDIGGQPVVINRYRKHATGKNTVTVEIDGTDYTRGTNKETDRFIEELLGLDFGAFVRSVYFDGTAIKSFPTLTDKEIKEIFEKVLGLDDLKKVAEVVKDRLKIANGNRTTVENDIKVEQVQVSTADVEIAGNRLKASDFDSDRSGKVGALVGQIAAIKAQPIPDKQDLDRQEADILTEKTALEAKIAGFAGLDQMRDAFLKQRSDIASQVGFLEKTGLPALRNQPAVVSEETRQAGWQIQGEAQRLSAEHAQALAEGADAARKIGTPCSECGKSYTEGDLGHIVAHDAERVKKIEARLFELQRQHAALKAQGDAEIQAGREALNGRIVKAEAELAALKGQLADLDAKLQKCDQLVTMRGDAQNALQALPGRLSAISAARAAAEHRDASCALLQSQIDALQAAPNPYVAEISRWQQRHDDHRAKIDALLIRLNEIRDEIADLKVLDEAYGRTGLKAHILEQVTPVLDERANYYTGRLADGQVKVKFDTITKNKDGSISEKFCVNVTNSHGSEGYLGNSSGEKKKIDLSIALAISDLVAARSSKSIDLWVADEIAESLDPTAVDRVVDVLKDKAVERGSLLCISHSDMRDLIPNVLTIHKTAAGSTIGLGAGGGW